VKLSKEKEDLFQGRIVGLQKTRAFDIIKSSKCEIHLI
jgi:hypothetical protein